MDFSISAEQEMVVQMVRSFAEKEVAPIIKDHDREQRTNPDVVRRMGELGLLAF